MSGLRVIDSSAIPLMLSGHLNAPVIMMAEKGADMILEDNDKRRAVRHPAAGSRPKGGQDDVSSDGAANTPVVWLLLAALTLSFLAKIYSRE